MASVGRKRKADKDLPKYWKRKHGAIYFIVPRRHAAVGKVGAWIKLGATEEEAYRTYANLLAGQRAGTMQQGFDKFEKEVIPTKKSAKTRKDYKLMIKRLGAWCGHMPQGSLSRGLIQRYVDARPPVAANRELSLLNQACKKMMRWGWLNDNPCVGVERNEERPAREGVDHVYLAMAWRLALPWMRATMALAYVIGQRRGDVRKVKETDFNSAGALRLKQNKTDTELLLESTRNLKAVREYALAVRPLKNPIGRWLICNEFGRPISESVFKREWTRIQAELVKQGGERFKFKSIRTQSGTDHPTGKHLGHVDERTLNKFYRLGPKKVTPI